LNEFLFLFLIIHMYVYRYAIVEELAQLGATVHTCSRNEAELNESLNEWSTKGYRVTGSVCDVTSRVNREELIATVSSQFNGKLNILVGHVLFSPFHTKTCLTITRMRTNSGSNL